jgi:hypothetical protein
MTSLPRIGDRRRERSAGHQREQREDSIELSEPVEEPSVQAVPPSLPIPVEEPYHIDLEA